MIDEVAARTFRKMAFMTVCAVYFLILVGGIVRASGAGMGCPDWPTCFGRWIPPTEESQLPADYHQRYAIGYENTQFNPVKTWTEYLNRLTGATIGLLILLTAWKSRAYLKSDKAVCYLAVTVFFLVSFQGWLGATVVASNLKPFIITLHMLLALFIVALLVYILARSQKALIAPIDPNSLAKPFSKVLTAVLSMTLLQVMMGTQVREAVDFIANKHSYIDRQYWRDDFPVIFYVHRSFSAVILFANGWLVWQLYKQMDKDSTPVKAGLLLMGLIATAILAGITMDRLGMPPAAQPIHLLMANLIFGVQFYIFIYLSYAK
ncbi:partial cytochrome c oxidase assembly protein subunit 15, partial [biofilm metagenome]